jgi:uncharacterized ion transporter superfamily protein YfcC
MKNKYIIIGIIIIVLSLLTNVFVLGMYVNKPKEVIQVEENKIEVEMDKSCYDQFKNNMDKTIFVKLYLKE